MEIDDRARNGSDRRIALLIDADNVPHSKIADMLAEQGIECARRTVAKYREALKIPPANLRKAV